MPSIGRQIELEIDWIDRRLQQNAERIAEELRWEGDDEDEPDEMDEYDVEAEGSSNNSPNFA